MEEWFLEKFNEYEQTCLNLKDAFDGKIMEVSYIHLWICIIVLINKNSYIKKGSFWRKKR